MLRRERAFPFFLLLLRLVASEFEFDLQPQPIRLNDLEEIYLTNDEHFLGQVLYRFDRLHLACECRSSRSFRIFWTINDRLIADPFNSSDLQLEISRDTVEAPVTDVTCHCLFAAKSRGEVEKSFRYQFYIGKAKRNETIRSTFPLSSVDLESEPTLKPIDYVLDMNVVQHRLAQFVHQPLFKIFFPFFLLIVVLTASLLVVSCLLSYHWI